MCEDAVRSDQAVHGRDQSVGKLRVLLLGASVMKSVTVSEHDTARPSLLHKYL